MDSEERVVGGYDGNGSASKRKRSMSAEALPPQAQPPSKTAKMSSSHLQINYLARQNIDILPMVSTDDPLPNVLQLLSDYTGVLERHESLAGNLGAKPLGPILIQRFERLFDGQPRVLKYHGKDGGAGVTWLDVVDFARQKPEQFNLEKTRDGLRVCQFYTKQSRVEISEDDYTLIASGLPQKLIPPQPIPEDEEKELGTLEIMEKKIAAVIQLADQVSARARQTKHRVTARKHAIVSRREAEALAEKAQSNEDESLNSPGFRSVNSHRPERLNGLASNGSQNGRNYLGATASPTTHAELLLLFNNGRQRVGDATETVTPTSARPPNISVKTKAKPVLDSIDYASILLNSASPVPIPRSPSTAANMRTTNNPPTERYDDSGPFKAEMLSRMENMARGEQVIPPCDRCRRLHIDCQKNLTACLGCTKKHAKCAWKEVTKQELADNPFTKPRTAKPVEDVSAAAAAAAAAARRNSAEDDKLKSPAGEGPVNSEPVRDEELLGEDDDSGSDGALPPPAPVAPITPVENLHKLDSDPEDTKPPPLSLTTIMVPNETNLEHRLGSDGAADVDPAFVVPRGSNTLNQRPNSTIESTKAAAINGSADAAMTSPPEAVPKEQGSHGIAGIPQNARAEEHRTSTSHTATVNGFASVNRASPPLAVAQHISNPAPAAETGVGAMNGDTETRNIASGEVATQSSASLYT